MSFTSPPYNAGKSEALSGNTHTTDNKYNEYNDNQTKDNYLNLLIGFTNNAILYSDYLICNIQSLAGNKIALIEYLNEYKDNFIDVDTRGVDALIEINNIIHDINTNCMPDGDKDVMVVETKNGYHLITTPFNVLQWSGKRIYDIHKNNPTILFSI